jgi:sulfur-carrier protein
VTIRYFANIRPLAGCSEEQWTKAAPRLRDLLAGLAASHGALLAQRLFNGEQLHPEIHVFVNGRDVVHLKGLETPLSGNDVIAIFPTVGGG